MAELNLLQNGELETDFQPFRQDESKRVPLGWAPWWVARAKSSTVPDWQNQVPTFDARFVDGRMVARVKSPYATHTAGIFQQVPAVEGERYELTADGMAWSSEAEEDGVLREGTDVNMQIGVDPTGGLDPQSPVIHWCEPMQPLGKWEPLRLNVIAQASIMTVFLKSAPYLPKRQQSVFWRQAALRPVGRYKRAINIVGPGDTHIQLAPERPNPVETVKAIVSSRRNHRYVTFKVKEPQGKPVEVALLGGRQADDRYFWEYEFRVEEEGLYDLRFVGDRGARLLSQRLVRAAREVQIVPRGKPRTDYRRVYVLLPPTADEKWFAAAARGSFEGRYTVGFSADDAGIGDVAERIVIGVNPHHWPETLTSSWYQQHYPGTRFIPVVANSAADLEAWLGEWIDA